jgi:hypothetical protein
MAPVELERPWPAKDDIVLVPCKVIQVFDQYSVTVEVHERQTPGKYRTVFTIYNSELKR